MHNEGKIQNIKASFEKYIHDNIVMIEGLNVNFEGLPFESEGKVEWIQESMMKGGYDYHRQVDNENYGKTSVIMINFNIFVNKDKVKKTNRHYEIRDIIAEYFKIGTQVDLYDFSQADFNNSLQKMKLREIVTDQVISDNDFYQYNYTCSFDWLEKW